MANGTVIGDVLELLPVTQADAASRLLLVEERFDEQGRGQDLIARRVEKIGARHMRGADRLALAAAQAILDGVADVADIALLHDERLVAHQPETWRPRMTKIGARHQLACIEVAVRIDFALVLLKRSHLRIGQVLELGQANAMLARNDAVKIAGDLHDARHRLVRLTQHVVIVGIDRDVGVDVAVARMHVQRDEHPAFEHPVVDGVEFGHHRCEIFATEEPLELCAHFPFPGNADGAILHDIEHPGVGLAGQAVA